MTNRFPTMVKVQIIIALAAILITIGVALEIPRLLDTKQELLGTKEKLLEEIALLEERKQEAERSVGVLVKELNVQKSTPEKRSIVPRASATPIPAEVRSTSKQNFNYRLWLEMPSNLATRVSLVTYHFDHPTFRNKIQTSKERNSGFTVRYRGWGCLYLVTIKVHFNDGRTETIYFDMCAAL